MAVATAAAGTAAYVMKKALAGSESTPTSPAEREDAQGGFAVGASSRSWALLPAVLDSAPDMLLPLIDNAAEAAGRWVARNSPELIRDRLLPRFIGAFSDATRVQRRG